MSNLTFNEIGNFIINANTAKKRKDWLILSSFIEVGSKIMMGVCTIAATIALVSLFAHPIIAGLGLAFAALGFVLFHDIAIVSKNFKEIINDEGLLGNLTTKMATLITPQRFFNHLLKDTWLIESFKAVCVRAFN